MEIRFTSSKLLRSPADAELPLPVLRAPDLSGRVLGARYSLRRRIGGGSMGTVYQARDMTLGTAVAVKVLHPEYSGDQEFRRRFHQEALLGARLRHEHSVAVTDLGQSDDGLLYSVMEYLEGESLDGLLSSRPGPLPWRRVVTIAVQVCAALQAAHDRGVIHRDIKPGNCFLVRRDGPLPPHERDADADGPPFTFVKVLDLGLARLLPGTGRPTPPGRLGAPEYLAPEQIQGFTCDHRVDIYALGVMMYKLLTRRLPFTGDSPAAIMRMHIEAAPTSPRKLAPGAEIPASLEAVVLRALAKDRADRYPSAHAMAQAIRAAAADAEAETIAIHEDEPSGLWRRGLGPRAARGTPVSATMILVPAFGTGPDLHRGLLGLLLALSGILLIVALVLRCDPTAGRTVTRRDPPPRAAPGPTLATPIVPLTPLPGPFGPSAPHHDDPDLGVGVLADPEAPAPSAPRSPRRPPRPQADRPSSVDPRPAGTVLETVFHRLAENIAPGVYKCMRRHTPDRTTLAVGLTVGGPRSTASALRLPDGDHPALRRCLSPLLARLGFPPSERTADYVHVYRH